MIFHGLQAQEGEGTHTHTHTHIHLWLICVVVQQKPIKHCEGVILQLKSKIIKKKKKYMNLRRAGSKPKCLKAHLFGYVQIH